MAEIGKPWHAKWKLKRFLIFLPLAILATILAGCGSSGGEEASSALNLNEAPVISLIANPSSVQSNDSSTLEWLVENATSCQAFGAWSGEKPDVGSESVGPLTTTSVFILSCTGPAGTASQSTTVDVAGTAPAPAPTITLSASRTSVLVNETTTLTWSSTNATTCEAFDNWSGTKATAGSETTGPLTANSTFTLICSGLGGSAGQSVNVAVDASVPPPVPTVTIAASPTSAAYNGSTTLSWASTSANSCVASGDWSGSRSTSGSETRNGLTSSSTFILTCTGTGGSAAQSVTVSVSPPPLPTVSFTANPTTVNVNGSSTLTWSSTDATSCTAGADWSGTKSLTGSESVGPLTATSTFTLTCAGPGGSTSRPITVTVQAANGMADLSWIPPTTNEDGSPVTLTAFNIYSGSSPTNLQQIASVGVSQTTYTVSNLPIGTHYFAVTAVSDTGAESVFSDIASKTIP